MKIPEFKRSGIGLIVEFRRIPNRFPNQADDKVRCLCKDANAHKKEGKSVKKTSTNDFVTQWTSLMTVSTHQPH
jgi:hypothetical protein